jgi:hypothetical protein
MEFIAKKIIGLLVLIAIATITIIKINSINISIKKQAMEKFIFDFVE